MPPHLRDDTVPTRLLRLAALVVIVCILLAALLLASFFARLAPKIGGRGPPQSPHIVVDTLNLAHWLRERGPPHDPVATAKTKIRPLELADITMAIDQTAPSLRAQFPGKVMYVVKDRESQINTPEIRAAYKAAADRNQIWIYDVEQYSEPPPSETRQIRSEHAVRARDDLYMAILAQKHRCAVLTEDRFRDFSAFRAHVAPFRVFGYAYWRDMPEEEFIRPSAAAYSRLPKPRALRYAAVLGDLSSPQTV